MLKLGVLCAVVACATAMPVSPSAPPTFPGTYHINARFQIPYWNMSEPVEVWTDATAGNQRVEYYGGMDRSWVLSGTAGKAGLGVEVVPRVDHLICLKTSISPGPSANSDIIPPVPFLPDLSGWAYDGITRVNGLDCDTWTHSMTNYTKTANYTMYTHNGAPVRYRLEGLNVVQGSHPDIYLFDYDSFTPTFDKSVFELPEICKHAEEHEALPHHGRLASRLAADIRAVAIAMPPPASCPITAEFQAFMSTHNKAYANCDELLHRQSVFEANQRFVNEWNERNDVTHSVAINHFADLTDDEWTARLLPKNQRAADNHATRTHIAANSAPAASVDWRTKGAVTEVKDQGTCGSCWTFGAIGSLEGVVKNTLGKLPDLSEQQIVDCAWGYTWGGPMGNMACDGGYASGAFQWMIDNGGVATEAHYPYLGQDGWCNGKDRSGDIKVTGYVNVTGVEDLKDALANVGPVAVAIDASHPSFRFYASGVYYEPACKSDMNDLDHEVLAIGYGTEAGQDYWIIKNSWSTHWGDDGFVKMSMKQNNCGVATQATYPIV